MFGGKQVGERLSLVGFSCCFWASESSEKVSQTFSFFWRLEKSCLNVHFASPATISVVLSAVELATMQIVIIVFSSQIWNLILGRGLRLWSGGKGLRPEPQVDGLRGVRDGDRSHLRAASLHGRFPGGQAVRGEEDDNFINHNVEKPNH